MTFANDRQSSLQPRKTWVTSWVTHGAPIELPRKLELERQEITEKAGTWSHAIALLDLYSISRAEFELPETSARVRARCAAGVTRFCGGHLPAQKRASTPAPFDFHEADAGAITARVSDSQLLTDIEHRTFNFYWERTNHSNGLMADRWSTPSSCSITGTGFALTGTLPAKCPLWCADCSEQVLPAVG